MDFAFHLLALVNCDLLLEKSFFTFPLRIKVKSSIEKLFSGIFLYPFILTGITEMDFLTKYFPIWYPAWFLVKVKKFLQFLVL